MKHNPLAPDTALHRSPTLVIWDASKPCPELKGILDRLGNGPRKPAGWVATAADLRGGLIAEGIAFPKSHPWHEDNWVPIVDLDATTLADPFLKANRRVG